MQNDKKSTWVAFSINTSIMTFDIQVLYLQQIYAETQ